MGARRGRRSRSRLGAARTGRSTAPDFHIAPIIFRSAFGSQCNYTPSPPSLVDGVESRVVAAPEGGVSRPLQVVNRPALSPRKCGAAHFAVLCLVLPPCLFQ